MLDECNFAPPGHGRSVQLPKVLKNRVSQKSASNWLSGEVFTKHENLVEIANHFGYRAEWLEYGTGPKKDGGLINEKKLDREKLLQAVALVDRVIESKGFKINEAEKVNIMALVYEELMSEQSIQDREVELLAKAAAHE